MLNKIYDFLSSFKLSIFLTISGSLYYLFLTVWGGTSPSIFVQNISKMLIFKLLYISILINNFFCILRRFPQLLKLASKKLQFLPENYDWVRIENKNISEGFKIKNRFSSLGTIILHSSIFILALGFYISSKSHTEGIFLASEGEELFVSQEEIRVQRALKELSSQFPEFKLRIEKINYKFWEDKLLFTNLEAKGKIENKNFKIKINKPYLLNFSNFLRITSFGYAPFYMIIVKEYQKPLEEGVAKIPLFPPGTKQLFKTKHFPHKFYISLYPDFYEKDGTLGSKSMELKNPKLFIQVYRGKVFLKEKILSLNEPLEVEEFTIVFFGIFPILELTIVQDKGAMLIFFSFVSGLIGLILRISGKRGEILVVKEGENFKVYGKNVKEI